MININIWLLLSTFLFTIGLILIVTKKNTIVMLIGVELMFNAANINFISFDRHFEQNDGQIFSLFVLAIAVCESVVALAIILKAYQYFKTADSNKYS